jgi:hypothetical protein
MEGAKYLPIFYPGIEMKILKYFMLVFMLVFFLNFSVFAFTVDFIPSINFRETYTDNVNLASAEEKEHENIFSISPSITFNISGKNSGGEIFYEPSYNFYKDHTNYDGWVHRANIQTWVDISRKFRFELGDSFLKTDDPAENDFSLDENIFDPTIRTGRNIYYTNRIIASLIYQLGVSDTLSLTQEYGILENEDEAIEDNSNHLSSIEFILWLVPQKWRMETSFSFEKAEFEETMYGEGSDDFNHYISSLGIFKRFTSQIDGFIEYTHEIMDYKQSSVDYNIYHPTIGCQYFTGENAIISFAVGYFIQDRKEGDDEKGFTVDTDIGKTWLIRKGSLNLTCSSGYRESYLGAENLGFSLYQEASVNASYNFTRFFSANISESFRRDDYINSAENLVDETVGFGIGIDYTLFRWMLFSADYSFTNFKSNIDERGYKENRFFIQINFVTPDAIRLVK